MVTKTQITNYIKFAWAAHGTVVLASLAGFVFGLAIAMETPRLKGYLLERVMEWRSAALHGSAPKPELHSAAVALDTESSASASPAPEPLPAVLIETTGQSSSSAWSSSASSIRASAVTPSVSVTPAPAPVPVRSSSSRSVPSPLSSSSAGAVPAPRPDDRLRTRPTLENPASSDSSASSVSSVSVSPLKEQTDFPAFIKTLFPVSKIPAWGAMRTPAEWNRTYKEMTPEDFVAVPSYDMSKLTVPLESLLEPRNVPEITRKLFYSTRHFGAYDVDAGEFSAAHPGIDLKLPLGTPLGALAGGRVQTVENSGPMGLHVIIEHRTGGEVYYSIYGHLGFAAIKAGDDVRPGQFIGTVGSTGSTSGPHLHLQVDRGHGEAVHEPYLPSTLPSRAEAARWVINPLTFIAQHAKR